MPLPPYITEQLEDGERYQTVYNKVLGSAAAPTAGLHFTEELLQKIQEKGKDSLPDTSCWPWHLPSGEGRRCDSASYALRTLLGLAGGR